jgi:ISPg7 transposase
VVISEFMRGREGFAEVSEPVIGHCKADHRLGRNFYKGLFGDSINVMLAAAAFNFKRAIRLLLCLIERVIIWCAGRLTLNFQSQFTPLVFMKYGRVSF